MMAGFFGRLDDRIALVNRMAATAGADLIDAVAERRLGGTGLRDAVLRCTACPHDEECRSWLDAQDGRPAAAPAYCRNRALFERLASV